MKEYEHDIEKEGQIEVDLTDDEGNKMAKATIGVGRPGVDLSDKDETKVDDRGEPVVSGLPWGQVSTGHYLVIACGAGVVKPQSGHRGSHVVHDLSHFPGGAGSWLYVGACEGKPTWNQQVAGACLEIPYDLGNDHLKRKYVSEWVAHTAVESLNLIGVGFSMDHTTMGRRYKRLASEISVSAQRALEHIL